MDYISHSRYRIQVIQANDNRKSNDYVGMNQIYGVAFDHYVWLVLSLVIYNFLTDRIISLKHLSFVFCFFFFSRPLIFRLENKSDATWPLSSISTNKIGDWREDMKRWRVVNRFKLMCNILDWCALIKMFWLEEFFYEVLSASYKKKILNCQSYGDIHHVFIVLIPR